MIDTPLVCEETGAIALKGACPVHGGDACLNYSATPDAVSALRGDGPQAPGAKPSYTDLESALVAEREARERAEEEVAVTVEQLRVERNEWRDKAGRERIDMLNELERRVDLEALLRQMVVGLEGEPDLDELRLIAGAARPLLSDPEEAGDYVGKLIRYRQRAEKAEEALRLVEVSEADKMSADYAATTVRCHALVLEEDDPEDAAELWARIMALAQYQFASLSVVPAQKEERHG